MAIKIQPANLYNPSTSRKFMKSMASNGLARFILLEACVEAGRTYYAFKRGGFDEGRERFTEEFLGAVFWLGGVKAFNRMNDAIGKRILNLRTTDFDTGSDKARDTIANVLHNERNTKTGAKYTQKQIGVFKTTKLIASVLMANAMIGFVVPKMNQAITRARHKNDIIPPADSGKQANFEYFSGMSEFLENSKNKDKDLSFKGGGSALMKIAYALENNTTVQLLSTDVGTTAGRAISARNKHERREIVFRDVASIIFYMFSMPFINKIFNMIEQNGKGSRADSINADYTTDLMKQIVKENGGAMTPEELKSAMIGKEFTMPKAIKDKFVGDFMQLDEFKKIIKTIPGVTEENAAKYIDIAEGMAKLQPEVEGKLRVTLEQAERIFKGGYLNDPEYLKNLYELAFDEQKIFSKSKTGGIPNFLKPYKFISSEKIEAVDNDVKFYVEQIINKAKKAGKDVTEEMLERAAKTNFKFNVLNWGTGFVISAIFLSSIIPKMQYWITKKITGNDDFPGTAEFRHPQQQTQKV